MAELNPELSEWSSRTKTNAILADIFDALAMINANLMAVGTHKAAKKPKLYPRPGAKDPEATRHFGKDALPANELRDWFERKRAELCQK